MNIWQIFNLFNFYLNKAQGSYISVNEFIENLHVWQLSLYSEYQSKIGTSESKDTALDSFKVKFTFATSDTPLGVITLTDCFDILAIYTTPTIAGAPRQRPVDFPNADEIGARLSSQLIPNTTSDPFAELTSKNTIQLYPKTPQSGVVTYYKMPVKPVLATFLISGRVLAYDAGNSIQLGWSDKDVNTIIIRALTGVGINISAEDVQNWADKKEAGPLKT